MQHTALWETVLKSALLGGERQTLAFPPPDEQLGKLLAHFGHSEKEKLLLKVAATLTLYRRAGKMPQTLETPQFQLISPCDLADLPCCNHLAATTLGQILAEVQFRELLPEWLALATKAQQRIPEIYLPELLDLAQDQPNLQEMLATALGKRGHWLASQKPAWHAILAHQSNLDLESYWQTGTKNLRLALLRDLRANNPAKARELLLSTWKKEKGEDRIAFLKAFAIGLSMEDEPFLEEGVLNEPKLRKEARQVATELLKKLPASRLVQRMKARIEKMLSFVPAESGLKWPKGKAKFGTFTLTLPEECDLAMIQDGIDPTSQESIFGNKAWWFREVMAAIPPAFWQEKWQLSPSDLLKVAHENEWQKVLFSGWINATKRFAAETWAEALTQHWLAQAEPDLPQQLFPPLEILSQTTFEKLVFEAFQKDKEPIHYKHLSFRMLRARPPFAWSLALSQTVILSLKQRIRKDKKHSSGNWELHHNLQKFALAIHPTLLADHASAWPTEAEAWPHWETTISRFLTILKLRDEILKAFET